MDIRVGEEMIELRVCECGRIMSDEDWFSFGQCMWCEHLELETYN